MGPWTGAARLRTGPSTRGAGEAPRTAVTVVLALAVVRLEVMRFEVVRFDLGALAVAVEMPTSYRTLALTAVVLPATSRTVTVISLSPGCSGIPAANQLSVPSATPRPPRSLLQVTSARIAPLSALPLRSIVGA